MLVVVVVMVVPRRSLCDVGCGWKATIMERRGNQPLSKMVYLCLKKFPDRHPCHLPLTGKHAVSMPQQTGCVAVARSDVQVSERESP